MIYTITDQLSTKLQNSKLTASDAISMARKTTTYLQSLRESEKYQDFLESVKIDQDSLSEY